MVFFKKSTVAFSFVFYLKTVTVNVMFLKLIRKIDDVSSIFVTWTIFRINLYFAITVSLVIKQALRASRHLLSPFKMWRYKWRVTIRPVSLWVVYFFLNIIYKGCRLWKICSPPNLKETESSLSVIEDQEKVNKRKEQRRIHDIIQLFYPRLY